jgi:ABC-type lipoprotein release transport system permease subunit
MDAVRLRSGWLLRRHLVASLLFVFVAGVVGGVALTAWASSRRSASALDRFLAAADIPTLNLTFCPPGVDASDGDDVRSKCFSYDAADELEQVRKLPGVREATPVAARMGVVGDGEGSGVPFPVTMMRGVGLEGPNGRPMVVAGRMPADDADDEAAINEAFRDRYGVDVGDTVSLHLLSSDEVEGDEPRETGPSLTLDVVGLFRSEDDLNAALGNEAPTILQTPAGVESRAGGAATAYSAIMIRTDDDEAVRRAIGEAFAGRTFNSGYTYSADDFLPLEDAYAYEARAALAVAIVSALAGLIFVGQALARQVRREWSDLPALRALGMSRRQTGMSCLLRAAPIALGAAVVAIVTAIALSPWTPVGTARAAVIDRGAQVDAVVLAIGLPTLAGLVLVVGWLPVSRSARLGGPRRAGADRHTVSGLAVPPPASVGVSLALNGRTGGTGLPVGTAVIGVALGALALIASAGLVASLDRLLETPRLYGAAWDLSVSSAIGTEPEGLRSSLQEMEGVEKAGFILGNEFLVDGESTWVMAIEPLSSDLPAPMPTITRGREPIRPFEIALGALSLERLGLDLGDEIELSSTVAGRTGQSFTVVGEVVVNSTDEGSPGLGGVILPETLRQLESTVNEDIVVVDLAEGAAGDEARSAIEAAHTIDEVSGPIRQPAVGNLARLRVLPYVLAVLVATLAAGSLAHALVVSLRRNRRQLAVLKSIGFTRRQVSAAVACQATTLAGLALLVGIPLGILVARWGWRLVADQLGVAAGPVVPPLAVLGVAVAVVAFANLASLWPGWRAAHMPAAAALRTE